MKVNSYLYNGKELVDDLNLNLYDYGPRFYDPAIGRWSVGDPMAEKYSSWTPYHFVHNNPIKLVDPDGRAAVDINRGGDPVIDLFKRAGNYAVNRSKQAAYNITVGLTKSAVDYADKNYNPLTVYDNITNPQSDLPNWQAKSLAKYSDIAVSPDKFINSISGSSKNEVKRQEPGRGPFSSQSGGPTSRYVVDPANSDRVIDMRHFISIGDLGETIGLGVEIMQSTRERWRPSAFDLQDFYSNNLGQQFYNSNYFQEYQSGGVNFSQALNNFFRNRAEQ